MADFECSQSACEGFGAIVLERDTFIDEGAFRSDPEFPTDFSALTETAEICTKRGACLAIARSMETQNA